MKKAFNIKTLFCYYNFPHMFQGFISEITSGNAQTNANHEIQTSDPKLQGISTQISPTSKSYAYDTPNSKPQNKAATAKPRGGKTDFVKISEKKRNRKPKIKPKTPISKLYSI